MRAFMLLAVLLSAFAATAGGENLRAGAEAAIEANGDAERVLTTG